MLVYLRNFMPCPLLQQGVVQESGSSGCERPILNTEPVREVVMDRLGANGRCDSPVLKRERSDGVGSRGDGMRNRPSFNRSVSHVGGINKLACSSPKPLQGRVSSTSPLQDKGISEAQATRMPPEPPPIRNQPSVAKGSVMRSEPGVVIDLACCPAPLSAALGPTKRRVLSREQLAFNAAFGWASEANIREGLKITPECPVPVRFSTEDK
jgi:hypothetical protein